MTLKRANSIFLISSIFLGLISPAYSNQENADTQLAKADSGYQEQSLIAANNLYFAADLDDEWDEDEEDWEDWEGWDAWDDDEDWDDDESEPVKAQEAPKTPQQSTKASVEPNTQSSKEKVAELESNPAIEKAIQEDNQSLEEKIQKDLQIEQLKRSKAYSKLAKSFSRPKEDIAKLYSQYPDILKDLDPENPKDLKEIEKLIEIVGVPKRVKKKRVATKPKVPRDDPTVNFSARSIPTRDAFATLARVSGKSITVSGQITDRDTISVVEINDQPFTKAFLSLVEAADVDFSAAGDNYTILKRRGARKTTLKAGLDTTEVDASLALEDRYADLIYENEDLASIIKDLANKYGVDVVMTASPTERITMRVAGVNIEDAFELIFSGSQFSYTRKNDTFVVYSASNKNFSLDKKTILFPLKYLEAAEASNLLPQELKTLVQVSEDQNAFIAEGSKAELTKLYEFLRTIDKPIPQVELNVQLVELSKTFLRSNNIYADSFSLGQLLSDTADVNPVTGAEINNVGRHIFEFNSNDIGILQSRPTFNQNRSNNQIKVNQRLLVTSGKSAKINFDTDVNVVLNAAETTGQVGIAQNQRIQRITAGNSMDITPVVGGGGVVTVKVDVEVSANGTIDANTGVPQSTVRRRLSSEIQIENNKTIAIGGLFDDRKGDRNDNEIPLLSRLPVIGHLFGNNSKSKDLTELLILITPNIIQPQEKEQIYIRAQGY